MHVEIDSKSGFCYGVVKTIQLAEKTLESGQPVYCLGEIVHNEEEVARLESLGMKTIAHADLDSISNAHVLLRAHGETPEIYTKIKDNANTLSDGTCPIVLSIQTKVRAAYNELYENGTIVIYGKLGHAEVIGLAGQTQNKAVIVSGIADLGLIDFSKPIAVFSQTTQSPEGYDQVCAEITKRMQSHFSDGNLPLKIHNTICGHVSKRAEHLAEFAKGYELIVFVCGSHSSNGKVLAQVCRSANSRTYQITNEHELDNSWFENVASVGICGATSTPAWLMEKVANKIRNIKKD